MMPKICMIIPAAGISSRHPPNKLLLYLENNTVIEKTVMAFIGFSIDIFVVVGHEKGKLKFLLSRRFGDRINIIENPKYKTGMASSIHSGIVAVGNKYDYYGFCNGDKPFISRKTVDFLLSEVIEKQPLILAPVYRDQIGHPSFFSTTFRDKFLQTTGEIGGRKILKDHSKDTLLIQVDDKGTVLDMDQYLSSSPLGNE